jgi:transposase InsO family protein
LADSPYNRVENELLDSTPVRHAPTFIPAKAEVFEYIEVFYNRQRAHSLLSYETPNAFEDCYEKKKAA